MLWIPNFVYCAVFHRPPINPQTVDGDRIRSHDLVRATFAVLDQSLLILVKLYSILSCNDEIREMARIGLRYRCANAHRDYEVQTKLPRQRRGRTQNRAPAPPPRWAAESR